MKLSKSYIKTLKETPKEAEVISHILMLRAGMIKKIASGVYSYLPFGYRSLKKVENIVREEMNRSGAQEILMPVIQPSEIWKESGRWDVMGPELMRIKDRHERDFVLGPTHEEVITDIVRNDISSYKSLPLNLYQIQTKFRDERRPRFGLMRGREFIMKDAYSFHTSQESLDKEFNNMEETYSRIFSRCGLKFRAVDADSGAIGGSGSKEFHVLAESGEDEIIYSDGCDYAANVETAVSKLINLPEEIKKDKELVHTPNSKTIEEVSDFLKVDMNKTVKSMVYKNMATDELYLVLIRGDLEVNEIKLKNLLNTVAVELATEEEIFKCGLTKGFIGPIDIKTLKIIADESIVNLPNHVVGANKDDYHFVNVNYGKDYKADVISDIRKAKEGDCCLYSNGKLHSARGIECGHIFKLGTKYSEALKANYLDEKGESKVMIMGCYGIGVSRTLAAAIEQNYDDNGIVWPSIIAPYVVNVIPASIKDEIQMKVSEEIYDELWKNNIDCVLDDRDERNGFKFKDADLIGYPFRIVVGKKVNDGIVELKIRKTGEVIEIKITEVTNKINELMKTY